MRAQALLLFAILVAGCASPAAPAPSSPDASGAGPDWSFSAIDGKTYTRDSPEGNATVLFFMATWCGTCRTKAPTVAKVVANYSDVRTYSLDFDPSESAQDLASWQARYQQPWPHGIDPDLRVQRTFEVRSQSSVVVLDGDGNVVKHFGYGQVTEGALREAIESARAA